MFLIPRFDLKFPLDPLNRSPGRRGFTAVLYVQRRPLGGGALGGSSEVSSASFSATTGGPLTGSEVFSA